MIKWDELLTWKYNDRISVSSNERDLTLNYLDCEHYSCGCSRPVVLSEASVVPTGWENHRWRRSCVENRYPVFRVEDLHWTLKLFRSRVRPPIRVPLNTVDTFRLNRCEWIPRRCQRVNVREETTKSNCLHESRRVLDFVRRLDRRFPCWQGEKWRIWKTVPIVFLYLQVDVEKRNNHQTDKK